jgi:hypothetical protein
MTGFFKNKRKRTYAYVRLVFEKMASFADLYYCK